MFTKIKFELSSHFKKKKQQLNSETSASKSANELANAQAIDQVGAR